MYRCEVNNQEVILRIAPKLCKSDIENENLYRKILSLGNKLLDFDDGHTFAIEDEGGALVIAEIQHGEVLVITLHHIVDKSFIYN